MIQKISSKYFSPFTPIAFATKRQSGFIEKHIKTQNLKMAVNTIKDSFEKIPELFY